MRLPLIALFLFACDSETTSDAEPDAGFADSGFVDSGVVDSGAEDVGFPDSGIHRDASVIDGSLAGTSLEGITIQWSAPLVLCEDWRFGGTPEDLEQAALEKVQVVLQPSARSTLEPGDLASATLAASTVHRSPYSADQFALDGATSTLITWELTGPPESAYLFAEIAHELGAAGTLFETIAVSRTNGDTSPIDYAIAAGFSYQPPDTERFDLVRCDHSDLERAVTVMSAFSGNQSITLIREGYTRTVLAGSAPYFPTRAEALLSPHVQYTDAILAEGHFTQLYTASLHNWNEHARIRFDRDRALEYLVFAPLARGEMPTYPPTVPRTIDLVQLNSPGGEPGSLELESLALPAGTVSNQSYAVEVDWTPIHDESLAFELAACPNPDFRTVWGVSASFVHLFRLGFCMSGDPITELALFVPVYFEPNARLVGQRSTAITQVTVMGQPGVEIDLGTHLVQISNPGVYRTIVLDAAQTQIDDTNLFETELFETRSFEDQTIDVESDDGTVRSTLVRRWVAQGAGNSSIFAPISFELTFGGETHRSVAWDKLDYVNSHHNWDDTLETDDGEIRMFWRVLDFGQAYEVRAERLSDGAEVLPPISLH